MTKYPLPRKIFTLWFGDTMNDVRRASLRNLHEVSGCELTLVTEDNLDDFVVPEFPLPPMFKFLQPVEKADYLRCYLLHFHGGGYSDVKATTGSWIQQFDNIDSSALDVVGYPLTSRSHTASLGLAPNRERLFGFSKASYWKRLGFMMRYRNLMGGGAFIIRPHSQFSSQYFRTVSAKMDDYGKWFRSEATQAEREQIRSGRFSIYSKEIVGYPLTWGSMVMDVLQPLSVTHSARVSLTLPVPVLTDYR